MWEKLKKWSFENQPATEPNGRIIRFGLLMAITIVLWLLTGFITIVFYLGVPDSPGAFGDMFGSVNALFSGMALAGIVYTIFIQKKEFQIQREELKLQREESKLTREVFVTQKFENTFFNLINLHQDIVKNLNWKIVNGDTDEVEFEFNGRAVFSHLIDKLQKDMRYHDGSEEQLDYILHDVIGKRFTLIEHYINYFNWIATFVYENTDIADQSVKNNYFRTLRAQYSTEERLVIFYIVLMTKDTNFSRKVANILSVQDLDKKLFHPNHELIYDRLFIEDISETI